MPVGRWRCAGGPRASSIGYGLGCEVDNLPTFVVLPDARGFAPNGPANWAAGFLPAAHQGTRIVPGGEPIPNMTIHDEPAALQAMELRTLAESVADSRRISS